MTDKSEGPYKLEQVRKTENSNEWFYRVVGPDGFLKIGNLPELNQYFIDLKVAYAAGFKAGLERAARLAEERSPPWPPMVYSPTRGTGPAKIFTPSPRSKRFDGGVGPR
ncbi:MAG: hypothetical protein IPK56_11750 [Elusimicrobia bacterium]|jgi:hypothetical protein|nr:hypothetical protein [Elusimicrobiota bacterium]MBK8127336.1 hypothetical protein [Elusimicrobiota bacterium]MBK9058129.1 hypothetical protein [Elusimicrobiota bacterium]